MRILKTIFAFTVVGLIQISTVRSQPVFLDTTPDSISLCTSDPGVRLPATNQFYLGEAHHGASSCSVHLSQSTKVKIDCGSQVQYEVRIILFDTSAEYILRPLTSISIDSLSEAPLNFDTEFSPEFEIMQHGIPYTSGCYRYHRIKWKVTDECGATAVLEELVDVYDCKKPLYAFSEEVYSGQALAGGVIIIDLDTFIVNLVDDCTPSSEFLISLSQDHYNRDTILDMCDAPSFGLEEVLKIWIADGGRDFNCNGNIEWTERSIIEDTALIVYLDNGVTDCYYDPTIRGIIITRLDLPIKGAYVSKETWNGQIVYETYEDGEYRFDQAAGYEVTINVEKNDNHKNGVTTLDLVRIQKHLLGSNVFTNAYDLVAADANNSQHISAIDLIEIRKMVLGIYTEFPSNLSWRFFPKDYVFTGFMNPNSQPLNVTFTMPDHDTTGIDFIGVKIGDVNHSAQPNVLSMSTRNDLPSLEFITGKGLYGINDRITIPVYSTKDFVLEGFQFTLSNPDLEFVSVTSGQIGISDDAYAVFGDHMTFSWFDPDPVYINTEIPLFSIEARAKRNGSLSKNLKINSDITQAEVYDENQNIFEPKLIFQSVEQKDDNMVTVYPNPWKDEVNFSFEMSNNAIVDFKLFDALGSEVYSIEKEAIVGKNIITVDKDNVRATGPLFYKLSSKDIRATGVVVKPY